MTNHKKIIPLKERFESKIEIIAESGCWIWMGALKDNGYGIMGLGTRAQGIEKCHRVSWQIYKGPIPDGLCVLHKCDVRPCCNPDHLYIGTLKQNAQDTVKRNRHFIPDNRGERASWSKLTEDNVRHIKAKELTGPEYASLYGVSKGAIYQIWRGHNWKSVA